MHLAYVTLRDTSVACAAQYDMAYWWVSQGRTYRAESGGGYVWAPLHDARGAELSTHKVLEDMRVGDVVVSFVTGCFYAVGVVTAGAIRHTKPVELGKDWEKDGRLVRVAYLELDEPYPLKDVSSAIMPHMPDSLSPLTRGGSRPGTGAQGYMYRLPARAARTLLERFAPLTLESTVVDHVVRAGASTKVRRELRNSLDGRGEYRRAVQRIWGDACAVTSVKADLMLRLEHVVPWLDADNQVRLDPENALLLAPNYAAAFRSGVLSFRGTGEAIYSRRLQPTDRQALGLQDGAKLRALGRPLRDYLAFHRDQVFLAA